MQTTIDKSKIALVHVAKNRLGLSEENYRNILKGVGVDSSVDLNESQFKSVMDIFKKLGFQSTANRQQRAYNKKRKTKGIKNQVWGCTSAERQYIESLWYEKARVKTSGALESFIFRIVKKSSAFITKSDVEKIINALKHLK